MNTRRGRRQSAEQAFHESLPSLDRRALRENHLLITPRSVTLPDLAAMLSLRDPSTDMRRDDELQLGDGVITGPWKISEALAQENDLPGDTAYCLRIEPERGRPVPRELLGLDEIADAFDQASPVGKEMDLLRHAWSVARFVEGSVRLSGPGLVIVPDPKSSVDRTVMASYFAEVDVVTAAIEESLGELKVLGGNGESMAINAPGPGADLITLEAATLPHVPPVTLGTGWRQITSYEIRWRPEDPTVVYGRRLSPKLRAARREVAAKISAAAAALEASTGGMVVDDDGFIRHEAT